MGKSMSIEASITVTLASVEVTDEYRVAMVTRKKLTDLSPDEAVQLAGELTAAATEAQEALAEHVATFKDAERFQPIPSDLWPETASEPISPDCAPGKHSACTGDAWDVEKDLPAPCACPCHETGAAA